MKWLPIFLLLLAPAHADKFIVGDGCGMCHDAVPPNKYPGADHIAMQLFKDGDTTDGIFFTYEIHPPTPQTPLPGALWLLAAPLLWLTWRAKR